MKVKFRDVKPITDDIKVVQKHIRFTRKDMKNDTLAFLDWEIAISNRGHLKVIA